ncbi:MAG: PilZ domain-containing protein [Gemmataceae bacterium]|nr:PilZ domain-containing protein [Gemmataceae bacterium]
MDKTDRLIEQTERLLSRVDALQQDMRQLQADLNSHILALGQHLNRASKRPGPSPIKPLSSQERRSTPRRKGNPVSVAIADAADESETIQGWVLDRSAGGLRLLVDEAVPAGTLLSVRPSKAPPSFPWVQVKVKSCYPERKSWNLGCQFVQKMSWEDLQLFG